MASAVFGCGCINNTAPAAPAEEINHSSPPLSVAVTIPPPTGSLPKQSEVTV
ncbi:hypothetical protein [Methanogenium cariaci]|uniref:hypothetical protein n=1 Tax=Methanogenium cariaci TaxID=2197 RepID=UPI001FE20ECC|nr:hypothetical protein [Methanogenium cariaci]